MHVFLLLFFLTKKVTKKSSEFDAGVSSSPKSPLTNSRLENLLFEDL